MCTYQQEWSSQRTTLKGRALDKTDGPEKESRNDANQSLSIKVLWWFSFEETGSDICAGFSRLGTLEFMNFEERLDVAWISQN